MLIFFEAIHFYISLAALAIVLIGLWMLGRSHSYLFFCAVFGIYFIGVVSVVVFPVYIPQSSVELNRGVQLNLVPFQFGRCDFLFLCLRNIYENILLTVPFGFGISLIARLKQKNILWLAFLIGFIFEAIQLVVSLAIQSSFRVVDINDVLLNAIGTLLGYGLFRVFGWLYLGFTQRFNVNHKYLLAYVHSVVRQSTDS